MSKHFSDYLSSNISLLEKLVKNLSKTFTYVSVLGSDVVGKNIRVSSMATNYNDGDFCERGYVVRVHNGINYAEYSFNDISEASLDNIIEKINKNAIVSADLRNASFIKPKKYDVFNEEEIEKDFARVYPSKELSGEEIVNRLTKLCKIMAGKENVLNAMVSLEHTDISKIFISTKKKLTQFYSWSSANLFCFVGKGEETRYAYEGYSGVDPEDCLKRADEGIDSVVKNANDMIGCGMIEPGVYDIIADPGIAGLIAHEAFGHGVEMDMFVKGRAKAVEYVNKPVASKLVTMHEGAKVGEGIPHDVSSYFFDDEGTLAHDTIEIQNGILKTGVCDAVAALSLGIEPTGNGKRSSFERKAYSRMTSTYFEPGTSTVEEMIASIKHGYFITCSYSGMEDPKNWGIQCAALLGREIVDGKYTGKVVSPVLLTGYVPDLLGSISMLSKPFGLEGSGACGKGYKEWVKTACGGPYLKARVSIG